MLRPSLLAGCLWLVAVSLGTADTYTVVSVKTHGKNELPQFSAAHSYTNQQLAFHKDGRVLCIRPLPKAADGEMQFLAPRTGKVTRVPVPLPEGFKTESPSYSTFFDDPSIWVNAQGECFLRWTLWGNGDHALARYAPSTGFVTRRIKQSLACSDRNRVIASPDGSWFLLTWSGVIEVQSIDAQLKLQSLGEHRGLGRHWYGTVDACFLSGQVMQVFYAQVDGDNHAHYHAVDFDVAAKTWSARRTLGHCEAFVSSTEPSVVKLDDGALHYFWSVDSYSKIASGLYHRAPGKSAAVRLSAGIRYRVLAWGNRIVLCYTLEDAEDKVFFRVIHGDTLGPEYALDMRSSYGHNLWRDRMVLAPAGDDRFWFVNTQQINTFYELQVSAVRKSD